MNYLKRKLLGHVFMCGGGEGGGGGSDLGETAFGGSPAEANAIEGGAAASSAPSPGDSNPEPGQATGSVNAAAFGSGIVGGAMGASTAPLSSLSPVSIDPNAGKVAQVSADNTPAFNIGGVPEKTIDFNFPTAGSVVGQATGSKTAGTVANMVAGSNPITGAINAAAGLGNLAIGAINEATSNPEPKSGDMMSTDTVSGGLSGGAASGGAMAGGGSGPSESGMQGDPVAPTGIIGSAMGASPTPASTPPAPVAATQVNGNLFGNLTMGGWSKASRRFAARKQGVPA